MKLFLPVKRFFITYKAVVDLCWKADKRTFVALTLINSLDGILLLPSLYITKLLIDTVINTISNQDIQTGLRRLIIFLFLDFVVISLKSLIGRINWVFEQNLSRVLSIYIEIELVRKFNLLEVKDAEDPNNQNLFQKVYEQSGNRAWGLMAPISYFPQLVFSLISATIPLASVNPLLIFAAIFLTIPEILVGMKNSKAEYELTTRLSPLWRLWYAYVEFLSKGRFLLENKVLNHTKYILKRINEIRGGLFDERFKLRFRFGLKRYFASIPLDVYSTIIRIYLYYQAMIRVISLGTAQLQFGAITSFSANLGSLIRQVNDIYENYLYIQDFHKFTSLKEEPRSNGTEKLSKFDQGIEFKDVWFKYPNTERWILKGVSFKVDTKDNIAIVGPNGAGKSTLIKLLCGFYQPQKGEIIVNGQNITKYSPDTYRKGISVLFQDFAQYPFSARENIIYGDIDKKEDLREIKRVARLAGIDKFVEGLPEGYDNPLENEFAGGVEPSKGQWQRIAISRALYRNAEILILDEPTSNVDPEAEEEIFENVIRLAKEKIVILVSHRFSTVRKADKILVIEGGKVEEYGSHEQLLKNEGSYSHLFNIQASAYQ